jgi:hypothetical protein
VAASTNDGNLPANSVDNSLATRWSGNGDGAWIRYDLGSIRSVTRVAIAAYRGNERKNRFDLQRSDDGTTWLPILTGQQTSGTTTAEQPFDFAPVDTRFVRYLGHSAVSNTGAAISWNSLTEVSLFAPGPVSATPTPTPTPTLTPTVTPTMPATATPTPGPSANLALNKSATGSTPCASTEGPEKAVNGSVSGGNSDKWCSHAAASFLQVDLGATLNLGSFILRHAGAGGESTTFNTRAFNIQVSTDGATWSTVVTVSANTASVTTHAITPIAARHVRLNVTTPTQTTDTAARIYELEVYAGGSPTPTFTPTPTPTSTPTPTPTPTLVPTGTPSANLALNRPAIGSASCNVNEGPEKAVNGSVSGGGSDKWCSQSGNQFLQVDLGGTHALTWFAVKHAGAGGESASLNTRDFDIRTSVDGTTFFPAVQVRGNTANVTTVGIPATSARFVRLEVLQGEQAGFTARIYELEAYSGSGGPTPTPPTPTPSPTPTAGPVCGTVNGVQYLRVYQSPLSQWCVASSEWSAHAADYSRFFAYGDTVVTTLNALFAFTPRGLPHTYQATAPSGGASTGSDFGLGVTVTGDAFYNDFPDPVDGTVVRGFWGYLLTLHESINVWTGQVTGSWPTDWWADHRSPFPNSMDYQIMKVIGQQQNDANLQAAATAQHRRMGVPGLSGFDSEVKMFDDFFTQFGGFPAYARVFSLVQADGLNWGAVSPNPSPLLSEYVGAYLSVGFGTRQDLTPTFVSSGVGTKDTSIPSYSIDPVVIGDIADAHCSIAAATGGTAAARAALQRGDYRNAKVPSTCSLCPTTTCACDSVTNQCVAPWRGR